MARTVSTPIEPPAVEPPATPVLPAQRSRDGGRQADRVTELAQQYGRSLAEDIDAMAPALKARGRWHEAIILPLARPSLFIRGGTFDRPAAQTWRSRLEPHRAILERVLPSVGRVEIVYDTVMHMGTAWMVGPDLAVTNRHVAEEFAQRDGDRWVFRARPTGEPLAAQVDFSEEHLGAPPFECQVTEVVWIADDTPGAPDAALLRLASPNGRPLPPPIPLYGPPASVGQLVAAIGYPARDPRNDLAEQDRIFDNTYGVKRLAPGEVSGLLDGGAAGDFAGSVAHDCTTLGGSSGSAIVDVATGSVVGLHYAGQYRQANYAVSAATLVSVIESITGSAPTTVAPIAAVVSVDEAVKDGEDSDVVVDAADLLGRAGFDEEFLGAGPFAVPLPTLSAAMARKAQVVDKKAKGVRKYLLPYTHYSVVMHAPRRMALFSAVNIDGAASQRLKRERDKWAYDPRIPVSVQVGNALYDRNDLDRGHLTRRLDPAWGGEAEATRGAIETFFFTNCSPQVAAYNQQTWAGLEDYLLDNADTLDFRASVFTGPVFDDSDKAYRGIKIPAAYWKVAVMIRTEPRTLSATAYLISQADLLSGVEFVYGGYKTFQIPVRQVEKLTGLSFGTLADADPLGGKEEGVLPRPRELRRVEDLVI
jgi:endonuclease G, mitochondrial